MATISGEVKVHAHYFEDGNLQLQTSKPVAAVQIPVVGEKDFAEAVANHIKSSETALQNGLHDMYANMKDETLKAMRRAMTVTNSKMEWNINAVRMVNQLTGPMSSSSKK